MIISFDLCHKHYRVFLFDLLFLSAIRQCRIRTVIHNHAQVLALNVSVQCKSDINTTNHSLIIILCLRLCPCGKPVCYTLIHPGNTKSQPILLSFYAHSMINIVFMLCYASILNTHILIWIN